MSKFAVIVAIEVLPGCMDEFLSLLIAHRKRCLNKEPGTLQFDILNPQDDRTKVMLYEVYKDRAAFDEHSKGSSIILMQEESKGMVVNVAETFCIPLV